MMPTARCLLCPEALSSTNPRRARVDRRWLSVKREDLAALVCAIKREYNVPAAIIVAHVGSRLSVQRPSL
jgi:hypothetical protein